MASVHCYFLLLPLLVSFLFINPASSDDQTQELIDHICRQMEEYGFCNQVFHENMEGPSTDIVGLTKTTVEQALLNASNTHTFINQLLQNVTDKAEKNALKECANAYQIVIVSFYDAFNYFSRKDYSNMVISERVTPRAQASCIDTFATPPNPLNPLIDNNRQMRILIAMAIVTGHELAS